MAFVPKEHKGIFTLDKWLRNLGLWRGKPLESLSEKDRAAILADMDWDTPKIMTGEAYDPDSKTNIMVSSQTKYDPETGIFEDKLVFWEHDKGDFSVIMMRGRRDPSQKDKNGIPEILPDVISVGGATIFNGTVHGGPHDAFEDKHRLAIDKAMSFSKRVKEALYNHDSMLDLGKILAGGRQHEDVLAEAFGASVRLPALSPRGGGRAALKAYFVDRFQQDDEQRDVYNFRQARNDRDEPVGLDPVAQLKAMMGHHINTVYEGRAVLDHDLQTDTEMSSGVRFKCEVKYEATPKGQKHRFNVRLVPEDVPSSIKAPQPIDLVDIEFTRKNEEEFVVSDANFYEGDRSIFRRWAASRDLIGLYKDIIRDIAEGRYPKLRDHIFKNRLHNHIPEMSKPPGEDVGGEMIILPVHSTGLEKTHEAGGNGIGGGICVMSRVTKNEGDPEKERVSEVMIADDLPWEPGGTNSAVDGYQPDLTQWLEALQKGVLRVSHDHFDHATLEYYAKNGWLREVPVLCNDRVWDIIEERFNKIGVPKEDWPQHIGYDHPDVRQVDEHHYVYTVRDEDGIARAHVQVCENAVLHSALNDSTMITACYGDDHYKDTVCIPSDNFGMTEHGKKFFKHGQLALARLEDVTLSKLRQNIKSVNEKYIAYVECTNISTAGTAADQVDQFRDNFRKMMHLYKDDAVLWHSFSTNHQERQAVYEVWAEEDTLRHSTSLGANSKSRDRNINKHSVDPFLDLRDFAVPHDKLPQSLYDIAREAVAAFMAKEEAEAARLAAKDTVKKTEEEILERNIPYRLFRHIHEQAIAAQEAGTAKPDILYRAFFSGDENAFDTIAAEAGLPAGEEKRKMPRHVIRAVEEYKKELRQELLEKGTYPDSATEYWMIRRYLKHGHVKFETKNNINEKAMYEAIMRDQAEAALHGSHTADYVKAFREQPGRLGIAGTGATGSLEEHMSFLSRYARGCSQVDDKHDGVNGYYLDNEKVPRTLFITQPPSMGEEAGMTQEALIRQIVASRNDTVILSVRDGFKIYNPKGRRREFETFFEQQGWNVQQSNANQMIVGGALMHVSGHGMWQDTVDFVKALPTKCIEAMHFPSWRAFNDFRQMMHKLGKNTSIEKPENYVACVPEEDPETGKTVIRQRDFLTQRRWGFTLDRKFGQQWGGMLKSVLYTLVRRDGNKRTDGLDIRTDMDGRYEQAVASGLAGDFTRAGDAHSARASKAGPSSAEMRSTQTRPKGRSAFGLSRFRAAYKKPEVS